MRGTITEQKDKCSFILGTESRCPYDGFKAPFDVINKSGTKKNVQKEKHQDLRKLKDLEGKHCDLYTHGVKRNHTMQE